LLNQNFLHLTEDQSQFYTLNRVGTRKKLGQLSNYRLKLSQLSNFETLSCCLRASFCWKACLQAWEKVWCCLCEVTLS